MTSTPTIDLDALQKVYDNRHVSTPHWFAWERASREALPVLIAKCRELQEEKARFREQCVDQMTRCGEIINERDDLRSQLAAAQERIRELEEALASIAAFAPGNGDVCEIIAGRARKAIATKEPSHD